MFVELVDLFAVFCQKSAIYTRAVTEPYFTSITIYDNEIPHLEILVGATTLKNIGSMYALH